MKAKYKRLWLKALRSGKYKQTRRVLHDEEGYCCLGVLCDVLKKDLGISWDDFGEGAFYFNGEDVALPDSVIEITDLAKGLEDIEPHVGEYRLKNGTMKDLASQNDGGKSFKQIANIIERYF